MKNSFLKGFALPCCTFAGLHFAAVSLIGLHLFSNYGFSHPPIRSIYEAVFGAGVFCLGLPDTVFGWLCNSALYGILGATALHLCKLTGLSETLKKLKTPNEDA